MQVAHRGPPDQGGPRHFPEVRLPPQITRTGLPALVAVCLALASLDACAQSLPPDRPGPASAEDPLPPGAVRRFGSLRFRMPVPARRVVFSADSALCALGTDKALSFLTWPDGRLLRTTVPEGSSVVSFTASQQQSRIVLARADASLATLELASGKLLQGAVLPAPVDEIKVSPNGDLVAGAGSDGVIYVARVSDGMLDRRLQCGSARLVALDWSRSGVLVAVDADSHATFWGADFARVGRFALSESPEEVRLSADGRTLFAVGGSEKLTAWEVKSGRLEFEFRADVSIVSRVACSRNGKLIATGGRSGVVRMWDSESRKLVWEKAAHAGWVTDITFSPDDGALVSCGEDRRIRALLSKTGEDLAPSEGHSDAVSSVVLSPDGRHLATTGFDGRVYVWRADTAEVVLSSPPGPKPWAAGAWASSSDRFFAACGSSVWAWELTERVPALLWQAPPGAIRGLAATAERGLVAGGTDTMARLISTETGKTIRTLEGHAAMVRAVASTPGGRFVATAGADGRIGIWTVGSGEVRWIEGQSGSLTSVTVTGDAKWIAAGGTDAGVRIWDMESGALVLTIRGFDGEVTGVAFSSDATLIAASTVGNSVRVCETAKGGQRALFRGNGGGVRSVCWGPSAATMYSAMYDTTALEWRLPRK